MVLNEEQWIKELREKRIAYQLPKKKLQKETLIKYYDLIRLTRCVIEESQRYLRLEHEDKGWGLGIFPFHL